MSDDDEKMYEPEIEHASSSDEESNCLSTKHRRHNAQRAWTSQSSVWEYFDKKNNSVGVCRLCQNEFSCRSTITNLKMHLKRKHPITYATMTGEIVFARERFVKTDGSPCPSPTGSPSAVASPSPTPADEQVLLLQDDTGKLEEFLVESEAPAAAARRRRSTSRRTAPLWRWFTDEHSAGGRRARCRVCGVRLSFTSSISNLKAHLKRRHPRHMTQLEELEIKINDSKATKREYELDAELEDESNAVTTAVTATTADEDNLDEKGKIVSEEPCTCGADLDGGVTAAHKPDCTKQLASSWDYYENISLDSAKCSVCAKVVSWKSNVNELRQHLVDDHPSIMIQDQDLQASAKANKPPSTHEVMIEEMYLDEDMLRDDEETLARTKRRKLEPPSRPGDDWDAALDRFGLYVASLLRMLPRTTAARFQVQIIDRLMKERMKRET